ncbi:MAG: Crp/Fnr family transcriptional regulator [Flavobacteriales bacterium]|nr:Crp/Fnr family transcriptional regulator [Flavobacteriales bacterium]
MELPVHFIDKNLKAELEAVGVVKSYHHESVIMKPGDIVEFLPIVAKGSLRIVLQNAAGEEYYLYHIFPGETCAMSLTCCQAMKRSEIKAVAEEDSELLMIPVRYVDEWTHYPEWKKFVSETQAQRFSELLETVELMAFSNLDEQLWNYLIHRVQATGNKILSITHQDIAQELNSPREVITRLLHQLQKKGKVVLSRGMITVNSQL